MTSVEMSTPAICSAVASCSDMPKMNAPISTHSGRPRASMQMTIAMKPCPWVMKGTKMPAPAIER